MIQVQELQTNRCLFPGFWYTEDTMSPFALIAEQRIQEAIRNGALDDLALKGQPLPQEDFSGVPEDLRMGYKILKNAGYLPEELQLRQEILALSDLLTACTTFEQRSAMQRKLTLQRLQYDILMEKRGTCLGDQAYQDKVERRLLRHP
jgi:hypothetical protein